MPTTLIIVRPDGPGSTKGTLTYEQLSFPCTLGRSSIIKAEDKREGDGATPAGTYLLRRLWYRADKLSDEPMCTLPKRIITPQDGWSDDVESANYNRPISLDPEHPPQESHEALFRADDDVYDLVVEIGYNDDPPIPGLGSAIFLHVAREGYTPTAGCVALNKEDLLALLAAIESTTTIRIEQA